MYGMVYRAGSNVAVHFDFFLFFPCRIFLDRICVRSHLRRNNTSCGKGLYVVSDFSCYRHPFICMASVLQTSLNASVSIAAPRCCLPSLVTDTPGPEPSRMVSARGRIFSLMISHAGFWSIQMVSIVRT